VGCVLYGTPSILRIHGVTNSLWAECQCYTILCTFCTVASPVHRVSASEVSIEIIGPVSDNGETRPRPYFRCGRCSGESFCCCHGHSCVTIVEHSQHAYCLLSITDQAVCLLCSEWRQYHVSNYKELTFRSYCMEKSSSEIFVQLEQKVFTRYGVQSLPSWPDRTTGLCFEAV